MFIFCVKYASLHMSQKYYSAGFSIDLDEIIHFVRQRVRNQLII